MQHPIDEIALAFNPTGLLVIQMALGIVMFGVALDLRVADFRSLARRPRGPVVGLVCQFLLLPAIAAPLAIWLAPSPSMALGMMLVAACPGGNVSNFLTSVAKGDLAISVGMTAISTAASLIMTPLNFSFWGGMTPETAALLRSLSLEPMDMVVSVAVLLGIPVVLGMSVAHWRPTWAARLRKPFRWGSIGFFALVVLGAFSANWKGFTLAIGDVFLPVLVLNAAALALGYGVAKIAGLPERARRAVSLEVGIQNSGLGLVLIFTFFGGLGGMAVVAAWWGIWHLVAGGVLAAWWGR